MKQVAGSYVLACVFWFFLFWPSASHLVNFWLVVSCACVILGGIALIFVRHEAKDIFFFRPGHILIGVIGACILYVICMLGKHLCVRIFDFAGADITQVYRTDSQAPRFLIGVLLLFLVGPLEEVYWRGFIQRRLQVFLGPLVGYCVAALAYALVHVFAFNLMLFMAALVAGCFWGAMFKKYRSLWPGMISHALWDVMIFILLPMK